MEGKERIFQESLLSFEAHMRSVGKEESTIRLYVSELDGLLVRLQSLRNSLRDVTAADLIAIRDDLLAKGMKPSTINKRMSIIRSFFRWAAVKDLAGPMVAERLRLEETGKAIIRWLTEEEERTLLSLVSNGREDQRSLRNEAVLTSMLYAGLRVEEVSMLRIDSIQSSRLSVYDEKSLIRSVPLDDRALIPLLKWQRHRKELGKSKHKESHYLFVTERSGRMQPRAVQFVIESLSGKAGFAVTCSMLRHTYCRRLAERGASVERIRDWAGHKSLLSTIQYFDT